MRRKKVIIVDDEKHYRDGLEDFLKREADVVVYDSPDAFAEVYTCPNDVQDIHLMILDYRFDTYNAMDKDLACYIRDDLNFQGKIVLWSLEDEVPSAFLKNLDAKFPKKIMTLYEMEQCLEK